MKHCISTALVAAVALTYNPLYLHGMNKKIVVANQIQKIEKNKGKTRENAPTNKTVSALNAIKYNNNNIQIHTTNTNNLYQNNSTGNDLFRVDDLLNFTEDDKKNFSQNFNKKKEIIYNCALSNPNGDFGQQGCGKTLSDIGSYKTHMKNKPCIDPENYYCQCGYSISLKKYKKLDLSQEELKKQKIEHIKSLFHKHGESCEVFKRNYTSYKQKNGIDQADEPSNVDIEHDFKNIFNDDNFFDNTNLL